jgi:hypothetical protein
MMGKARIKAGEPRLAVACFERWVEFVRESGDQRTEADALGWLGIGWTGAGFADRGTVALRHNFRSRARSAITALNCMLWENSDRRRRFSAISQAPPRFTANNYPSPGRRATKAAELDALENLGIAHSRLKDTGKAAHFHNEHLLAARATGDQSSESRALGISASGDPSGKS